MIHICVPFSANVGVDIFSESLRCSSFSPFYQIHLNHVFFFFKLHGLWVKMNLNSGCHTAASRDRLGTNDQILLEIYLQRQEKVILSVGVLCLLHNCW